MFETFSWLSVWLSVSVSVRGLRVWMVRGVRSCARLVRTPTFVNAVAHSQSVVMMMMKIWCCLIFLIRFCVGELFDLKCVGVSFPNSIFSDNLKIRNLLIA